MHDTEYKRLIHSAKERASSSVLSLVQRAMQEADRNIADAQAHARSGADQSALNAARHFLRQDGTVFLRRIDVLFRGYLERAMQTMYVDLRQDMRKRSLDELSLIDDDAINHQIEVGRLAERMRDANMEAIGRLNVIVGRLHGKQDARERENPFRPYLLARALYEAICETAGDDARARPLFDRLADALIQHLPGYYEAIREVFESSGVRGDFQAQRSRAAHNQRYFGAPSGDQPASGTRVLPGLQRLLESLQSAVPAAADAAQPPGAPAASVLVHEMIQRMLAPSRSFGLTSSNARPPPAKTSSGSLLERLNRHQQDAASGDGAARLSALREQLNLDDASPDERAIVDVVALLFEFILEDAQIPQEVRQHIARLQVPVLKAAVLQPELLHDDMHPARRLLNRISSAAAGTDPATAEGKALIAEIDRVTGGVLTVFATDSVVFENGLQAFDAFLVRLLKQEDKLTPPAIEAVEDAEKISVLLTNTTQALCEVMLSLNIDKRLSDFIIQAWPHVLVHAAAHDAEKKLAPDHAGALYPKFHAVVPELVWSVQPKRDQQERTALIRLLPELVKRLRAALQLIQLPEDEGKQILDQLVERHTAILRGSAGGDAKALPGLDELRRQFARVSVPWERASWTLSEPPQPRTAVIEEVFGKRGIAAALHLGASAAASAADREFLAQTYLLGTRVGLRGADEGSVTARLVWVSTHRSLYLFRQEDGAGLLLYTFASLLAALREEALVPLEYAPVFERAVEALLFDVANMPAGA